MKKSFLLVLAIVAMLSACNNQEEVNPIASTPQTNQKQSIAPEFDEVEVQVRAVDGSGNVITQDYGYQFEPYAYNVDTKQYIYPDPLPGQQIGGDTFELAPGTYRFDSRDGYFSGTSSKTVTITGNNEYELVSLNYWSE